MNKHEFRKALETQYTEPSFYESEVFDEWASRIEKNTPDYEYIMRAIVRAYSYKSFPPFKVYSACGPDIGNLASDESGGYYSELRTSVRSFLNNSKQWPADRIYNQYSIILKKRDKTPEEGFFIDFWSDFFAAVGLMRDRKLDHIFAQDDIKNMVLDGKRFSEVKFKHFRDEPPTIPPVSAERSRRVQEVDELF